jgi:hypothetical protein
MIDTIKDIFIVLYFQQNPCLSIKKYAVHNIHRLAWELYARDVPGQLARMPIRLDETVFKDKLYIIHYLLFVYLCLY